MSVSNSRRVWLTWSKRKLLVWFWTRLMKGFVFTILCWQFSRVLRWRINQLLCSTCPLYNGSLLAIVICDPDWRWSCSWGVKVGLSREHFITRPRPSREELLVQKVLDLFLLVYILKALRLQLRSRKSHIFALSNFRNVPRPDKITLHNLIHNSSSRLSREELLVQNVL